MKKCKTDTYIERYGLKIIEFKKVDLNSLYCQYIPEVKEDDRKINKSPHLELSKLYYKHGVDWLERNFKNTKYYAFQKIISSGKYYVPKKKIRLFDSLKKGYLKNGHEREHVVILNKPFAFTRYGVDISLTLSPEIFIGHHRVGALLALGEREAEVIIAKDIRPMTCQCYGKLHNIYKDIK